jgi:hypothetical protein
VTARQLIFSGLPAIEALEVVDLRDVEAARVGSFMANAGGAPSVRLSGKAAQSIADLWRALPHGEQDRCHAPPFGIRFHFVNQATLHVSICWQCNNVFGFDADAPTHGEFDAGSAAARELFFRLAAATTSWESFTLPDGASRPQLEVSPVADRDLFESTAATLATALDGVWTHKLDGPDARYWDLVAEGGRITLHLETFVGIVLYPTEGSAADLASLWLFTQAHRALARVRPG